MTFTILPKTKLKAYIHAQLTQNSTLQFVEVPDFYPVILDKTLFIVHKEWNYSSWGKGYRVSCPQTGGSIQRPPASPTKEEELRQLVMHFEHMDWSFNEVCAKCRSSAHVLTPNAQEWVDLERRTKLQMAAMEE